MALRRIHRSSLRWLLLVLAALAATGALAQAQARVEGGLHVRPGPEPGTLRAAVVLDVEPGWHVYHEVLGHPEAVGAPTLVELAAEGVRWSEVRFPDPVRHGQGFDGADGEEVWIWIHEGRVVLHAAGRAEGPGAPGPVTARVKGLVCAESCLPFSLALEAQGPGPDALFAGFPADLSAPGAEAEAAPDVGAGASERPDEHGGGHADATLHHRVDGRTVEVAIEVRLDPGWHLYHASLGHPEAIGRPTMVQFAGSSGARWDDVRWPEPEKAGQGLEGSDGEEIWIWQHSGTFVLRARGELPEGGELGELAVTIEGLTCEDDGQCVPYRETLYSRGRGSDALFSAGASEAPAAGTAALAPPDGGEASDGGAPAAGGVASTLDEVRDAGTARFLLLAVLWGLFTLLMPCTYPMIPITISFFTKQADARGGNVLSLALAYGAGIVLVFVLIGAAIGPAIIPFATHAVTNVVIAVAFLYFALVLFGVAKLEPPRALMNLAGQASRTGGYAGVFLMGTTLVVTSFTCTAPFVGSLLGLGAASGELGRVVLGMTVFGLTIAIPFVFLSLVPRRIQALPRSGEWMNTLKISLGFVELAAAFKFISNVDLKWKWFVLSYEVFLFLWAVIFLALAAYLLGAFAKDRSRIGGKRRVIGVLAGLFALYVAWGGSGHKLDPVMMAMAPPYSGGRLMPVLYERPHAWTIVIDDYDRAIEVARIEGKDVLVNFTGFL